MKRAFLFAALFLLITEIVAVLISSHFLELGFAAFENPSSSNNVLILLIIFPLVLIIALLFLRRGRKKLLKGFFLVAISFTLYSTLVVICSMFLNEVFSAIIPLPATISILYLLVKKKKWYIADLVGFILACGITSMLGISLIPILMAALLIALAVYDFVSVYITKHMVNMADQVMDMSLPVLLIFPDEPRKFEGLSSKEKREEKSSVENESKEKKAFFLGLGDIVIPSSYVVSLYTFLNAGVAAFAALGTMVGLIVLLIITAKTKANAGLPFINSFALIFSLIGYSFL